MRKKPAAVRNVDEFLKKTKKRTQDDESWLDADDFLAGFNYWFVLLVLGVAILVLAVLSVLQVQSRHDTYQELARSVREFNQMKLEEERLLLEQQTFSATPTVVERSVGELAMFYPDDKHRLVLKDDQ